jgi:hypothetical protein
MRIKLGFVLGFSALLLSGCGGGSSSGDTASSTGDFFTDYASFVNSYAGDYDTKSINFYNGDIYESQGCAVFDSISSDDVASARSATTVVAENYACGPLPSDSSVTQCIYLNNNVEHDKRYRDEDVENDVIVKNPFGLTELESSYFNGIANLTLKSLSTSAEACNGSGPTAFYSSTDIVGNWTSRVLEFEPSGLPQQISSGVTVCTESDCQGNLIISDLTFVESYNSWVGVSTIDGVDYVNTAVVISKDKRNMSVLACSSSSEVKDYINECKLVSAYK